MTPMNFRKTQNLKLKLGNLLLAAALSTVPTAMTLGFLGVHGLIICSNLNQSILVNKELAVRASCEKANWDASFSYVIWIWLFITLPTWRWFYIGHYRRIKSKDQRNT